MCRVQVGLGATATGPNCSPSWPKIQATHRPRPSSSHSSPHPVYPAFPGITLYHHIISIICASSLHTASSSTAQPYLLPAQNTATSSQNQSNQLRSEGSSLFTSPPLSGHRLNNHSDRLSAPYPSVRILTCLHSTIPATSSSSILLIILKTCTTTLSPIIIMAGLAELLDYPPPTVAITVNKSHRKRLLYQKTLAW